MRKSHFALIGLGLAATALIVTSAASAQSSYATRPVRLVVGFGAGGPTDIPARFIADKLGTQIGHRVIVENKPGAAGMIATRDVLSQRPTDTICCSARILNRSTPPSIAIRSSSLPTSHRFR
jgi:tripartite-type tricarboxylate transporter receptor subunit TctC